LEADHLQLRFNATHSATTLNLAPSDGKMRATPRIRPVRKRGAQERSWRTKHRKKPNMPNDSHQRAAEFHELAAHAHRAAAAHHGKEDHQTGHEHSKQAMEYANKAMEWSQESHRRSRKVAGNAWPWI